MLKILAKRKQDNKIINLEDLSDEEKVLIEKNNIVENVSVIDKFLIHKNKLKKYDFDKKYQNLEQVNKELSKTDIQEARYDIYVKLKNMFNACEFNSVKTKINKNYNKIKL